MVFTGTSSLNLPQVSQFSFLITGIRISDTGLMNISFLDTGSGQFSFAFSGGYVINNKIISTYNTIQETNIAGYVSGGQLSYQINGITNQNSIAFSTLDTFEIQANNSTMTCDAIFSANNINYSLSFLPNYNCYGILTGTLTTDTAFYLDNYSFVFGNTNQQILTGNYSGALMNSGVNTLQFQDIDYVLMEYTNPFTLSLTTTFGEINESFVTQRTGVTNQNILFIADYETNDYAQYSLFNGYWSGNSFTYVDNYLDYNLGYNFGNTDYVGDDLSGVLTVAFQPISPLNNSGYTASYITGFNLVSGGTYSGVPSIAFSQYYYVTGIQNAIQSFLFSTGCVNSISVTFSGGCPTSGASGSLILKPVTLSGIYNTGLAKFNIVSGYSEISNGYAYQAIPSFVLATGGGCYSVPDASGSTAQFKPAIGLGAVYSLAAGLTGIALTSSKTGISGVITGYSVTGLEVTNIGFGYNTTFPPNIQFIRQNGDSNHSNASGNFTYKTTGNYNFTGFWGVQYNLNSVGYQNLSGYNGYYSGQIPFFGENSVTLSLSCSGLDNTSAVSGMLTLSLSGNGDIMTEQKYVFQSRTFNLNTGALAPNSYPVNNFYPLPDLSNLFDESQNDLEYQANFGGGDNNIINF